MPDSMHADALAAERRAESIVRSSAMARAIDRTLTVVLAAWQDAFAGALLRRAGNRLRAHTAADRAHLAGVVAAVAGVTALIVQRQATRPAPLIGIVPLLFLVVGLGLLVVPREGPER